MYSRRLLQVLPRRMRRLTFSRTPHSDRVFSHISGSHSASQGLTSHSIAKLDLPPRPNQIPAPVLDWSRTPLSNEYFGHYVKVIDDLFTPEECAALLALAESDAHWTQAAIHYGLEARQQFVNTEYRNSERILRFDKHAAGLIYQRLLPHVHELVEVTPDSPWKSVVARTGRFESGRWRLDGINDRLSFLRYGPGHYFKGHCDGQVELPDGRKSRVTVQIYLGDDDLEGGATRISDAVGKGRFYDVEAKKGRTLIFQQRGIWHSGEEVIKGTKYTLRSDFMFRATDASGEEVAVEKGTKYTLPSSNFVFRTNTKKR